MKTFKYSNEDKKKVLARIKTLRKWAIENNMMKSKVGNLKV